LRFLKWKMEDGKWIHHPRALLEAVARFAKAS